MISGELVSGSFMWCPWCIKLVRLGSPGVLVKTAGVADDWSREQKDWYERARLILVRMKGERERAEAAARAKMS